MTADIEERLVAALERQSDLLERLEKRLDTPATPLAAERRLATAAEAMALIGCKRTRLFKLIREGKITRVLEGHELHVEVGSIDRYLDSLTAPAKRGPGRPRKTAQQRELEAIAKLKVE